MFADLKRNYCDAEDMTVDCNKMEAMLKVPSQHKRTATLSSEYGASQLLLCPSQIRPSFESNLRPSFESNAIHITQNSALMAEEDREMGSVGFHVYTSYIKAAGGWTTFFVVCLTAMAAQVSSVFTGLWLSWWTSQSMIFIFISRPLIEYSLPHSMYMGVFGALGLSLVAFLTALSITIAHAALSASKQLHNNAIESVLKSPISFFDTTPLGRILNRFSKDIDSADYLVGDSMRGFLSSLCIIFSTFALVCAILPIFLVPLVPILCIYYFIQSFYRQCGFCIFIRFNLPSAAREIKRLDAISRSPLFAQFSESLSGLTIIRTYDVGEQFISKNTELIRQNFRAYTAIFWTQRWLAVRLETSANILA